MQRQYVDVNLKGKEIKERERYHRRMRIRERKRERVFSVTEGEYFYRERHAHLKCQEKDRSLTVSCFDPRRGEREYF